MRVDDGDTVRQFIALEMVVGDDELHALLFDVLRLFHGGDAVVDGDDELRPGGGDAVHDLIAEAVAVPFPFRQHVGDVGTLGFEIGVQDGRRRDTVAVVVSVDTDAFPVEDGVVDPFDRLVHIGQQERIDPFLGIVKELVEFVKRVEPPLGQQQRRQRVDGIPFRNGGRQVLIQFLYCPLFARHGFCFS